MANLQQIAASLMQTLDNNTATLKQAEFYLEKASKEDTFIAILLSIPQMEDVSRTLFSIQPSSLELPPSMPSPTPATWCFGETKRSSIKPPSKCSSSWARAPSTSSTRTRWEQPCNT